jgi:hypothetical protein
VTLPAINVRAVVATPRYYSLPTFWQQGPMNAYFGSFFTDFAEQNRQFMTEEEVVDLVNKLIEAEDRK